ncbi:putative 2-amino-3-carboxymuconate-6-semialdehyde decarboxylase [Umbelopsis sp. PMI_123]|nr:putative 2-amino-3-carboxymuconate-6-semialdehyde decarboxylase [Umbelopsis sp. PMI_123]
MLPLITLEEHFVSRAVYDSPVAAKLGMENFPPAIPKLLSLGKQRIKDMDDGHVSLQVISHNPACVLDVDTCQKTNDQLPKAVKLYPSRFAGFAVLPMKEQGFVGALAPNHADGVFYDGEDYNILFDKFQELNVPIYIHPTNPSDDSLLFIKATMTLICNLFFPHLVGAGMLIVDYISCVSMPAVSLIDSKTSIILGHNGELVPFLLERTNTALNIIASRDRTLKQVWDENIWVTTSGMFTLPPLYLLLKTTKIDRILYSVDYPFASNKAGEEFIKELSKSGFVTEEELEMIAYRNAESLLNVKARHE